MDYLDFKTAKCKDCFKCLRECPVKAIKFENHQAKILSDKCILCGHCTLVCPQNAKKVHSELVDVEALLLGGCKVVASVAPAFVSSFSVQDFSVLKQGLKDIGFDEVEETAVGAREVTKEYAKLLNSGKYKNFITSACPAINRMLQLYYPDALKYLAPVASPMVAHARILKQKYPDYKIVFIGPCIAKKREAAESGVIDGVLTFEELKVLFDKKKVDLRQIAPSANSAADEGLNRARYYPINMGIIKSFMDFPDGYEYVAVDGVHRSFEVLEDIDKLTGMFIEVNCCEHACINGPCSIKKEGGSLKANEEVRKYATSAKTEGDYSVAEANLDEAHPRLDYPIKYPTEKEVKAILAKTGKLKPEDELNCGACGYNSCREKAVAVYNGTADVEMCIPYMRLRAEMVSHEIIQNSPAGVIVLDNDFVIIEINSYAKTLLGIDASSAIGLNAFEWFNTEDFIKASTDGKNVSRKRIFIDKTKKYAELSIMLMKEHKLICGILRDVTDRVTYDKQLAAVKEETLSTTDAVIQKQMRVAQEIASLLGETTAETKVALLKLKKTLKDEEDKD